MSSASINSLDILHVEIKSKEFGRIATQNAKNVILQKIREEERSVIYNQYFEKEKDVVTGVVQRYVGKNISINLGKADAILNESEQVTKRVSLLISFSFSKMSSASINSLFIFLYPPD